ncbi:uncharacterized protein LOC135701956 [Ochlerotatus camptorhynchus]|uniref:uncharacterized protein LOC135701956 n=1 Tax=Ochlerotatus camptorhynchus TaxID=644619 RepID=UPI0031E3FC8A
MFSFAANGRIIPPDIILARKRLDLETLRCFPSDWGLGKSENGWMDTHNFVLYIKKILHPALVKSNTTFPIIYFVDGHSSHVALEAADMCQQLGIVLIALYPNATRILQPADVAIFGPLKSSWGKVVDLWRSNHPTERMSLATFGQLLQEAMNKALKQSTIMNGFSACGLYPFNPDAINYSKCIGKSSDANPYDLEITNGMVESDQLKTT